MADGVTPPSGAGWQKANFSYFFSCDPSKPPGQALCVNGATYDKVVPLFADVRVATKNGDATGTYSITTTSSVTSVPFCYNENEFDPCNWWYLGADTYYQSYAPQVTLTQTPQSFRPRDGREDAIAHCITADAQGQTHDGDCHPQFTLQVWLNMGEGGSPDYLQAYLNPQATLTIEHAPGQTAWLPGNSTNNGTDSASFPDYAFEAAENPGLPQPSADGTSLANIPLTLDNPLNVVVTSRDYGGSAILRGQVTMAGIVLDATVVDPTTYATVAAPSCVSADDFAAHPFASLPVDWDCNGIADGWEDTNSPQTDANGNPVTDAQGNILHLPIDWDQEPGYTPDSPKGDGWSVHDEYRGFHFVADDGTTVKWISTDPVNKIDVFFWDDSVPPARPNRNITYSFTQALRTILCLQGSADEMAANAGAANCAHGINEANAQLGIGANPLRYLYRRVNPQQAQAKDSGDATKGVNRFNINSLTAQAGTSKYRYAAVYHDAPGALNKRPLYNLVYIVTGKLSAFDMVFGETQLGQEPVGASCTAPGTCTFRIDIDTKAITTFLSVPSLRSFPQPTLLAEVTAHETGHLFDRRHPVRPNCCDYGPTATENNFTFPNNKDTPSNTVNVLLEQPYTYHGFQVPPEDLCFPSGAQCFSGTEGGSGRKTQASGFYPPGTYLYPFQVKDPGTPVSTSDHPWVQTQLQKLMDWMPYLNLQTPAQWQFAPADLNGLCARIPCN